LTGVFQATAPAGTRLEKGSFTNRGPLSIREKKKKKFEGGGKMQMGKEKRKKKEGPDGGGGGEGIMEKPRQFPKTKE